MQSQLWCKICGITNSQDALAVQRAGADAMGLVFYPASKRYISLQQAAEISTAVDRVTKVGLFVDPEADDVRRSIDAAGLDLLQFQGEEPMAFCEQFGLPYMKGVRVGMACLDVEAVIEAHSSAWAFLLDTYVDGEHGGTGQSFDRALWPDRADARLILAGGLAPDNVASAIADIAGRGGRLFGVDVSTGVELSVAGLRDKRRKDPVAIDTFVNEVNHAHR